MPDAATVPMSHAHQQELLEAPDTGTRLGRIMVILGEELRAMSAIPSLPATQIATNTWSPN